MASATKECLKIKRSAQTRNVFTQKRGLRTFHHICYYYRMSNADGFHSAIWTAPQTCADYGLLCQRKALDLRKLAKKSRTYATDRPENRGPIAEYDSRIAAGRLCNDEHQRDIIQNLQRLHQDLRSFNPPPIPTRYEILANKKIKCLSICERIFGGSSARRTGSSEIPENVPRGLYLYGDVGSGKTMLMDLLYETLPTNVTSKLRVHFHNFMQDVHKRLHKLKTEHGTDIDGVPLIAADIAVKANVLCFDEFQCTDVADAMILRRFIEALMSFGVVLVTTSNRHPDDLYLNGIQRESFIPCIQLLKSRLDVINLDSTIDYRKLPRPTSGVYYSPLDSSAAIHAEKWFKYLGATSFHNPQPEVLTVWGREIQVPNVSGKAAMFTFDNLIGRPKSAADYIELTKHYNAFVLTNIPMMSHRERDLARRFITFIDAVYEARCKLVLTSAVPVDRLFVSKEEADESQLIATKRNENINEGKDLSDEMRNLMDDLGMGPKDVKNISIFSGDEEQFAFARALSRLTEMGSREWIQRETNESRMLPPSNDVVGATL